MSSDRLLLNAVGDIALFSIMQKRYEEQGLDPFARIKQVLQDCDVLAGDFEFPISRAGVPALPESFENYRVHPSAAEMLAGLRFDVLSLASNHIMDWGLEGIRTTQELLARMGIQTVGTGASCSEARRPVIVERLGMRLGFLAYAKPGAYSCTQNRPGAALLCLEDVVQDIAVLKPRVDHVILLLHWGIEFCDYPYPDDVALGRMFIDAGASVIFGCHAHVIQGIEKYKHGVIFYGLGNFVYDPRGERVFVDAKLKERYQCMVGQVWLTQFEVVSFDFIPCRIGEDGYTEVLRGDAAQALRCRVQAISAQIGDAYMVYATAVGSLLRRELQTYAFYLRRDGLRFVWRMIRNFKWRHVKLVSGYLFSRLFSRRHYEVR